jgi:hypothetical protein
LPPDAPAEVDDGSPVRKPYPVKLTDPILVFPGGGRTANVMLLQGFH